jgi:hypothetical protein
VESSLETSSLKTGILALSLTVTATVGLAADYEIFADITTVEETGVNHYAVERLDHKNKKRYHCAAVLDSKTEQLTGQCTEMPGFPENPKGKRTEPAGRDVKQVWRIARDGLLENRPDYWKNRVLYFRRCSVRGGNSAIDILQKMPSLEY